MAVAPGSYFVDGKVFSKDQIDRYRQVFDLFDINKDGVLEAREIASVGKVLGYRLPKQSILTILSHYDLDSNQKITFDEFLKAMPGNVNIITEEEHRRAEIRAVFQKFDRNGDGFIQRPEALQILKKELGFGKAQVDVLMKQFDVNSDGKLEYEEFVGFYLKISERKDAVDKSFKEFDKEGKGYVNMADAKRILCAMFSEQEVVTLFNAYDTNKDGMLQYSEFLRFWNT